MFNNLFFFFFILLTIFCFCSVLSFLEHVSLDFVLGGIKAVTVWQHEKFYSVVLKLHEFHCSKISDYLLHHENHDAMMLFFGIHEAIVAFQDQDECVVCLQKSYDTICSVLHDPKHSRLLHITLNGFYNMIPVSLKYAELLFVMWKKHSFIKTSVLELLLDVSGHEKRLIRNQWYSFLLGTHPRVGEHSAVQILTHKVDVLDLIFEEFDSFHKKSIAFLSHVHNPVWQRGIHGEKHLDKGLFCVAMSSLLLEVNSSVLCSILEFCIENCTCHDACFVCEYAAQVSSPSDALIDVLLERSSHWNFYVHDPARMALLCMNNCEIDKKLEILLNQPVHTLSVYKPVTEGCKDGKRRWRSFM